MIGRWPALLAAAAVAAGCGGDGARTPPSATPPGGPGTPDRSNLAQRPFSPTSIWNTRLADDAELDPDSERLSASVASMARTEGAALSVYSYSVPVYVVPADQPEVHVVPDVRNPSLHEALDRVPIPDDAEPSRGTDAHLVVYQPSTDTMWEFWRMRRLGATWRCGYGGRMLRVSENPGHFVELAGPGGEPIQQAYWGATATGFPLIAGLILPSELREGRIDHALAMALPRDFVRKGVLAAPAQRSDGRSNDPDAVPEGARFRLDPDLDLDTLGLTEPARVIAEAAQQYGMIVRDGAGAVALYAQDPVSLPSDPYPDLLDGHRPFEVLEGFPWDRLELMRMTLRPDS